MALTDRVELPDPPPRGAWTVSARPFGGLTDATLIGFGGAVVMLALWLTGGVTWWAALISIGGAVAIGMLYDRLRAAALERSAAAARVPVEPRGVPASTAAIVERFPDPILILDAQGRIVLANRAAQPIAGAASVGKHVSAVLRVPAVVDAIARARANGATEQVEYAVLVPVERHYHAHIVPAPSGGGERLTVVLLHDLTALKRVEQMRADFVANASHELRTPLAALTGFIETLRGHARDDEKAREKFLEIMAEQTARMRRLIGDLLSLSRIELNEHNPPSGRVDLVSVIRDVADALAPLAQQEKMAVEIAAPETPLPPVVGDRDELMQVFQNLIDNAIKYGRPETPVTVELGLAPELGKRSASPVMVYASVRDRGEGIRREDLPRLTERFYRVDVKRSRERGGTGLGLAIVKHIVNRHQGRLEIESRLGEGSTFTVRLPSATDEAGARPAA